MHVLLDECLPRRLSRVLSGHDVRTVPEAGWAGKGNGELLQLASPSFEVFVTMDQNLQYQQNLQDASIAIIVLECPTNRFDDLLPLVSRLLDALQGELTPGQVLRIGD